MSAVDTRDLKRDSLFMMADIRVDGSAQVERVRVRNLSDKGIMVQGMLVAHVGQRVTVGLKKIGEVGGTIAWNQSARIGIAFDEPIDASQARTNLVSERVEIPRYARPAVTPPSHDYKVRKL